MRAVLTSAVTKFAPEKRERVRGAQIVGLAIASIVPALIWCALINAIAMWIGAGPLSLLATVLTGVIIALFLAIVCAPLILRNQG